MSFSLTDILIIYIMMNVIMTLEAMILDIRLQRALGNKHLGITQTVGAFVLCSLLMMPMRLYMMSRKRRGRR